MVTATKNVAMLGVELTVEERNLLSRAYKHQIAKKRESWRMITACEDKEKRSIDERSGAFVGHIAKYRLDLQSEICAVCRDLLALLDAYVIPHTASAEARVFFFKMYYSYSYIYIYYNIICYSISTCIYLYLFTQIFARVGRGTTIDTWRSLVRRPSGRSPS
jgi:hypothetical protein